jgi:aspartate/methionine/tyrosine aminotransferase
VSDFLATQALRARTRVLARTRAILNRNYPVLETWLRDRHGLLEWREPDAGAICCARFTRPVNTLELAERIRVERSLLIVPGEHFGMPHHVRIGYGEEAGIFGEALAALAEGLKKVAQG